MEAGVVFWIVPSLCQVASKTSIMMGYGLVVGLVKHALRRYCVFIPYWMVMVTFS